MTILCSLLLIIIGVGAWRVWRGPSSAERALGVQMMSTAVIALLVVAADWLSLPPLRDVALVLALLAAVVIAALVQHLRGTSNG